MDQLDQLRNRVRQRLIAFILLENAVLIAIWWGGLEYFGLGYTDLAAISLTTAIVLGLAIATSVSGRAMQPLKAIWQAIVHLSPEDHAVPAPKVEELRLGRELITNLIGQLNQLVNVAQQVAARTEAEERDLGHNFIAQNLPLPLIITDNTETIVFANQPAASYLGVAVDQLKGKNVYAVLDMAFPSQDTFDKWLKEVKTKSATASRTWERVRLNVNDSHPARLFDLAAYYNRDNPDKIESILTIFDHTSQYSQDDQAVSFIALSVHELRTPLTLLRGYIEVFEEELGDKISDPELRGFMEKMRAQAEHLTSFVNNILNVARVDDDQLELHLEESDWSAILKDSVETLSLQARIRGITLNCQVAPGLPTVGVDQLSIQEVIGNLVDNAIKYSGDSKVINIDAHINREGQVETTVQDFGFGIPNNIMQNLFTKFYRDHRNRAQVGGTGLGLYLSKAIIEAHGGHLWVRSKPGKGSVFGFTLTPYAQLAEEQKRTGSRDLTRSAHGWIKNHSLYRR
ncbi:MAG TPA: ATP-binding protein [Candidatus Saccharimonadales bacterium]|nr:ATP-binding protein [Candidatus Saccharimonadales bacterium]